MIAAGSLHFAYFHLWLALLIIVCLALDIVVVVENPLLKVGLVRVRASCSSWVILLIWVHLVVMSWIYAVKVCLTVWYSDAVLGDKQVGLKLLRLDGRLTWFTRHVVSVGLSRNFTMLCSVLLFALVLLATTHWVCLLAFTDLAVARWFLTLIYIVVLIGLGLKLRRLLTESTSFLCACVWECLSIFVSGVVHAL